jgi:hypothetical protein
MNHNPTAKAAETPEIASDPKIMFFFFMVCLK